MSEDRADAGTVRRVSLNEAFASIPELWSPRIAARVHGTDVKAARIKGEFVWHKHDDADELFLVMKGRLRIELRAGAIELGPGELAVIPRGVEHRPVADDEVWLVLIEPIGVVSTGDADDPRRVDDPDWL